MIYLILIAITFIMGIILVVSNDINKRVSAMAVLGLSLGWLLGKINTPAIDLYQKAEYALEACEQSLILGHKCNVIITTSVSRIER
jgi:hypothetical protein